MYEVSYFRHDTKPPKAETKTREANTMAEAVQRLFNEAQHHNVVISSISCTIQKSVASQRFCDVCLTKEAIYSFKGNVYKCKGCK
jgi:Ni,Fe-hydrogenase III small subunit